MTDSIHHKGIHYRLSACKENSPRSYCGACYHVLLLVKDFSKPKSAGAGLGWSALLQHTARLAEWVRRLSDLDVLSGVWTERSLADFNDQWIDKNARFVRLNASPPCRKRRNFQCTLWQEKQSASSADIHLKGSSVGLKSRQFPGFFDLNYFC